MKTICLETSTIDIGDVDWSPITSMLQDYTAYSLTPTDEEIQRSIDAELLLINKTKINSEFIKKTPKLKAVFEMATGYDNIDIDACTKNNIAVYNVAGYSTDAVVQHTLALLLELLNKVGYYNDIVKKGKWHESKMFCHYDHSIRELNELTVGILGHGTIGKKLKNTLIALGCKVIIYSEHMPIDHNRFVEFDHMVSQSDIVVLATSLRSKNKNKINAAVFKKMKKSAFLINTARGGLVAEEDLYLALTNKEIAGAAIDVLQSEPPSDSKLTNLNNCIVTPHIAWASTKSRQTLINNLAKNISDFLGNNGQNALNANQLKQHDGK